MDFVPIEPYVSTRMLGFTTLNLLTLSASTRMLSWLALVNTCPRKSELHAYTKPGQRYNVIVEALPANDLIPEEDQNYWIRIVGATECSKIIQDNPLVGIVRYNAGSQKTPTSLPYQFRTDCADEPYESLVPLVRRDVDAGPHPANEREYQGILLWIDG